MKKIISLLLILTLLVSLPFATLAEEELENQEPSQTPEIEQPSDKVDPPIEEEKPEDIVGESTEPIFHFTAPNKIFYTVGEAADYTGGSVIYTTGVTYTFSLNEQNCSGFDTSTPGIKTVTVSVTKDAPKYYFNIIVLQEEESIGQMTDINRSHWSYSAFGPTMKAGIFKGDDQKRLRPDAPITRAEMAALIYRCWGNDPRIMVEDSPNAAAPFNDVSADAWYYKEVEALRKAGILRGDEKGQCLPDAQIKRQDAVLMLMRLQYTDEQMAAINIQETVNKSGVAPTDFDQTSPYAQSAMAMALGDLIHGDNNKAINPLKSISRAETATILLREFFEGYLWEPPAQPMPLIFLSPSSQIHNEYAGIKTTEGIQMNLLAQVIKTKLEAEGYRVYLAGPDTTYQQRAALSNQLQADLHIPIHSNSGSGGPGTYIFYNGSIEGSKELSQEIFKRLAALTGTPTDSKHLKEDFLSLAPNQTPYHEIRVPTAEMAYIEVEFHDTAAKAQWIVNNHEAMAAAITEGIMAYCEAYLLK